MCCPCFDPVTPCAKTPPADSAMLPLGELWNGVCRAVGSAPLHIRDAEQIPLCNLGYARGTCARGPGDEHPDAVRFAIGIDPTGAEHIRYSIERDHYPVAHGILAPAAVDAEPLLAAQARAYFTSYQRRTCEAAAE